MAADIYDWISQLRSNQQVLDVGSGEGSFPGAEFSCAWLALDDDSRAFTTAVRYSRVVGRSHQLPVRKGSIDLLICHHSLEHLAPLDETLAEMARDRCDLAATLDRLDAWRDGLTPEMLRAAGGDRFAPRPLREVAA